MNRDELIRQWSESRLSDEERKLVIIPIREDLGEAFRTVLLPKLKANAQRRRESFAMVQLPRSIRRGTRE